MQARKANGCPKHAHFFNILLIILNLPLRFKKKINLLNKINGNFIGIHEVALLSAVSRSNWNLKCWFLWREENQSTQRKAVGAGTRTNNKLNPHMTPRLGIELNTTLVGGECSHHCTIPAPPEDILLGHLTDWLKALCLLSVNFLLDLC